MPDITLCTGEGCPLKDECYRYKAKPSERQSYFERPPYKGDKCDYFSKLWQKENKSAEK
jgi:hypothetical protein